MLKVVLFTTSLVRQGPNNVLYNMLAAAKRNGSNIDFEILTLSPEGEDSRYTEFKALGIPITCMEYPAGFSSLFHIREIEEKIKCMQPDIVQSANFRPDILLSFMKLPGVIKLSTMWNCPYDEFTTLFSKRKGAIMSAVLLRRLKQFDAVTACSQFIVNRVKRNGLTIGIIYTGVDSGYFSPVTAQERISARQKLGIETDDTVFIYIANMITRKNPLYLIRAFKKFVAPKAKLLIMGNGPLFEDAQKLAEGDSRIIFLGRKAGTLEDLRYSDFYVSPSMSEGFPTAVLEAASVGLKPILSNIQPHMELINYDPDKLAFSLDSEESLIKCLEAAMVDKRKFDYRKLVAENFTDDQMYYNYRNLYKYLTGNVIVR